MPLGPILFIIYILASTVWSVSVACFLALSACSVLVVLSFSNTGGRDITEFALKQWKMGREREDIKLKELEDILIGTAFNEKGKYVVGSGLLLLYCTCLNNLCSLWMQWIEIKEDTLCGISLDWSRTVHDLDTVAYSWANLCKRKWFNLIISCTQTFELRYDKQCLQLKFM